ncbi:hypothetical protein [Paraburkholderia youngii]|uniref:hypothetical protein n=1 Tax=Paraburkholderia youngii TaxID=2782701 RepID=UPI003D25C2D6
MTKKWAQFFSTATHSTSRRPRQRCVPFWSGIQSTNDSLRISAFWAIEMALWDLRATAWNLPLYKPLGSAVRKQIPFTDYFAFARTALR